MLFAFPGPDDDAGFDTDNLAADLDTRDPHTLLASAQRKVSSVQHFAQGGLTSSVDGLRAELTAGCAREERELEKEKSDAEKELDAKLAGELVELEAATGGSMKSVADAGQAAVDRTAILSTLAQTEVEDGRTQALEELAGAAGEQKRRVGLHAGADRGRIGEARGRARTKADDHADEQRKGLRVAAGDAAESATHAGEEQAKIIHQAIQLRASEVPAGPERDAILRLGEERAALAKRVAKELSLIHI